MVQFRLETQFQDTTGDASKQNSVMIRSYRPVYIVSRIFGQMPFSIAYHSNGDIHRPVVKKLDALWFLLSMIAFICIIYLLIKFVNTDEIFNNLSPISFMGNYAIFVISSFYGLLAIISDMCFRSKIVDIFKKIDTFDKEVSLIV